MIISQYRFIIASRLWVVGWRYHRQRKAFSVADLLDLFGFLRLESNLDLFGFLSNRLETTLLLGDGSWFDTKFAEVRERGQPYGIIDHTFQYVFS